VTKFIPITTDFSTNRIVYDTPFVQPNTWVRNGRWKIRLRGEKARARRRLKRACPQGIPFKAFLRDQDQA
jgi:hypothetical protein